MTVFFGLIERIKVCDTLLPYMLNDRYKDIFNSIHVSSFEILEIPDKTALKKTIFLSVIDRYKKRKENFSVQKQLVIFKSIKNVKKRIFNLGFANSRPKYLTLFIFRNYFMSPVSVNANQSHLLMVKLQIRYSFFQYVL